MTDEDKTAEGPIRHGRGSGTSQAPATAYADAMTQLTRRVTELEARMAEGGLKDGQTLRARVYANEEWANTADDRLEALEAFEKRSLDAHADKLERIEAIEFAQDHGAANAEMTRQDRWHATRDAVVAAIANGQWECVDGSLVGINAASSGPCARSATSAADPCPYCTWMGKQSWFSGSELAKSLFLNAHSLDTCPHRFRMKSFEVKP